MNTKVLFVGVMLFANMVWAHGVAGVVTTRDLEDGSELLTDVEGMTLYTFDPDAGGNSACYNGCAKAWPPLVVAADKAQLLKGDFSGTQRKDGTIQVRFDGKPLYTYIGDSQPGDVNGDGVQGVWHKAVDSEQ
ncbi:MAG TPA: hypothetical protein VN132_07305 [Bdellovibrio sp.]|nr:hypothetical protein [Bdellovibrio sp.]